MIVIDYHDKRPLYEQIIDRFQMLILSGILEPDEQLPSVRALALDLSINANTIQRAYSELESRGLIYSVKGRGNFVSSRDKTCKQQEILLGKLKNELLTCRESGVSLEDVSAVICEVYQEVKA